MGKSNKFIIKAKKELCKGQISEGDTFTVHSDNPMAPGHADVQEALEAEGIEFGFFNKPTAHSSDWEISKSD